jgi:hypothetical protein
MVNTSAENRTIRLEIPDSIALQVTREQFEALAIANRDLQLERTARGELIVNPPTGGESGKRNFRISGQLGNWVEANEELGEGFDSSTGFILPNGAISPTLLGFVGNGGNLSPRNRKKGSFPSVRISSSSYVPSRIASRPYRPNAGVYRQWNPIRVVNRPAE